MAQAFYQRSLVISAVVHTVLIGGALCLALLQGCFHPQTEIIPVEFTVAVATAEDGGPEVVKPDEPPPPPPPRLREPPRPQALPEEPDRVADPREKPVEKPREKAKPAEKPTEKPPPKPPPRPAETIRQNRRVLRGPNNPNVKQTLTDAEIEKWLRDRNVRPGVRDSLPTSEEQMNFSLVRKALYDAWNAPPPASAGYRPAEVEFSIDASGRVSGARIVQSSGSAVFDESALAAVRSIDRIPGLSVRFLERNRKLTVEFKLPS